MNNSIEIKNIINKKAYLTEAYSIIMNYKRLLTNPKRKIYPLFISRMFCIFMAIIWCIFAFCINNDQTVNFFVAGIMLMVIVICVKDIVIAYNYINRRSKEKSNSTITINKNEVVLQNLNDNITYKCNFDKIKYILITKNCISFLPINKEVGFLISIPIDFKDECLELLKHYDKIELVIDNS